MQTTMGTIPGKAPIKNFPGQTASGFYPLDPSGAAGPNHYVQMINSTTFRNICCNDSIDPDQCTSSAFQCAIDSSTFATLEPQMNIRSASTV